MDNHGNYIEESACESIAYIPLKVSAPISLKPCIRQLPITAEICGKPKLKPTTCGTYILTQHLTVKVPMEIDVKSIIDDSYQKCECLEDCKEESIPRYDIYGQINIVIDG